MAGIRRRDFIAAAGSTAVAWPLVAGAQQPERMRRIGVLMALAESEDTRAHFAKFRQELEKLGWSEGKNVRIAVRFAAGKTDQFKKLAKDLVDLQPDVLLAQSPPIAAAFQRESRAIPIVFVSVSDPIGSGFVENLARPGGNLTGLLQFEAGITGKWLAMLKAIAPHLARAALVANPKTTGGNA
jgi:putative ABC transport system substrate-binding protein